MSLLDDALEGMAAAWEAGYEAGYADKTVEAPPIRRNPYKAKQEGEK
jgi:hypothetical protein